MSGRPVRKLLAGAVLAAAAAGCKSGPDLPAGTPPVPGTGPKYSIFPPKPPGPPPATATETAAATPAGKKPLSPGFIAQFAHAEVDAAFNADDSSGADRNRLLDEARAKYQKALERDPKNYEALRGLARLHTRAGDREQAAAAYAAWLQHHPADHKAVYEQSLAAARFEDWEGAAAACKKALSMDPSSLRYTRALGVCEARCGRYQEGLDALAKVLPEAEARTTLARVFADQGQADAARQQLELVAKADPKFAPAQELLAALTGQPPAGGLQQAGAVLPAGQ